MKNNKKTFKKESFMQGVLAIMFSQVLIKLLGVIYKLYLTNKEGFGDEGNAIYSSGFQIYALLLTLSSTGVPGAISKLVSEKSAVGDIKGLNRIVRIAFVTFAIIGLFGTIALILGAKLISNVWLQIPEAELTIIALAPSVFFVAISSVLRGYFIGIGSIKASAMSQTLEQVFKTFLTIFVVYIVSAVTFKNTEFMAAGANLATTLSTFLSFGYLFMFFKIHKREVQIINKDTTNNSNYKNETVKKIIKNILLVAIPISLTSILSSINKNIDAITVVRGLKTFMTEAEAKIQYGILGGKVDTLTTLPLGFNVAFATALVPAIAAAKAKGEMQTAKKRISFSLLTSMLIGLPCTFGMLIFAEPILQLLFPNATSGTLLLQFSSLTIIFTAISQTVNGALQGMGKVMVPAIAFSIGVIVKFILNIVLIPIPQIGANGAAIGSIACNFIALIIGYIILNKYLKLHINVVKSIIKPIIATIIMSITSYYIYIIAIKSLSIKISIIIYVISILLLKIFDKKDLLMIPYGEKLYKVLKKLNIYKEEQNPEK